MIESVTTTPFSGILWDLTVDGAHTFHVGDGQWLVHNCAAPVRTPWGWSGSRPYRAVVRTVDQGGTLTSVSGVVPSRQVAEQLIRDAGGQVLRVEGPHMPPNPHSYPHINFVTSSGQRGTIRIEGT